MSEPDRFDAQARELVARWYGPPLSRESVPWLAAALRAEHASALERAAQIVEQTTSRYYSGAPSDAIIKIRALIPPAAAPAAETGKAQRAEARDAEWIEALRLYGVYLDGGRIWQNQPSGHSYDLKLKRLLAARAAPPEREGA